MYRSCDEAMTFVQMLATPNSRLGTPNPYDKTPVGVRFTGK
jgi:hypothetical protein